jgi:hypothetical protein
MWGLFTGDHPASLCCLSLGPDRRHLWRWRDQTSQRRTAWTCGRNDTFSNAYQEVKGNWPHILLLNLHVCSSFYFSKKNNLCESLFGQMQQNWITTRAGHALFWPSRLRFRAPWRTTSRLRFCAFIWPGQDRTDWIRHDMQHGHRNAARAYSMNMQHGHSAWTCSTDIQHGRAAMKCSIDRSMWRGHTV